MSNATMRVLHSKAYQYGFRVRRGPDGLIRINRSARSPHGKLSRRFCTIDAALEFVTKPVESTITTLKGPKRT